jgi:hypothetical protein
VTAAAAVPVITMTGTDGQRHYVTEDAAAGGRRSGRYVGACGREIIPASLTVTDGAPCRSCGLWAGDRP